MLDDSNDSGAVWLAERLRVTIFPSDPAAITSGPSWQDLVSDEPEVVEDHPRNQTKIFKGSFANGNLLLVHALNRIDLVYELDIDRSIVRDRTFPNLGPMDSCFAEFKPIIEKWIASFSKINRIGFAPALVLPVADHKEAYDRLDSFLPNVNVDPQTTDFSYQINRPRQSTIMPGLTINRLCRWNAVVFNLVAPSNMAICKYACRLDIDVNTHASFQDGFSAKDIPNVFGELVDLSIEISKNGDIP